MKYAQVLFAAIAASFSHSVTAQQAAGLKWARVDTLPVAPQARTGSSGGIGKGSSKSGSSKRGGSKKGSKKGQTFGRKCGKGLKNLRFTIIPDRERPDEIDFSPPNIGGKWSFVGDYFGSWTQLAVGLADFEIVTGHDTFRFFEESASSFEEPAGALTTQFSQDSIVVTAGTGIFACANGEPLLALSEETGQEQILFDLCVCDTKMK